jgi:histidinol-phosphate/aromatic aminotransferase/cobyric acid decarboxylase-like protein/imidazoleglycerol phosphate dehydratase HisB
MRRLPHGFKGYEWAPSTEEIARRFGLDPGAVVRFDANVPAQPPHSARPSRIAAALAEINSYTHGGYRGLVDAIAAYCGVEPEHVVLGAGADDLILLSARAFAGPGDRVSVAHEPTYPLYRIAAGLAGAEVSDEDAVVTFCCRPNNPSGALDDMPASRPLVVDEAYWEFAGETAVGLLDTGVVVIRTFSKAFALAGARVGYALATSSTAAELRRRQAPLPVSRLSAALALEALRDPPDVAPVVAERERCADALRSLGLDPWPSYTNFLFVPVDDPRVLGEALLSRGAVVRVFAQGIRFNVRDASDDDFLIDSLAESLGRPSPVPAPGRSRIRHSRATAHTRVRVRLALEGSGRVTIDAPIGDYARMLEQLAVHAGFDLALDAVGDPGPPHHMLDDVAQTLGEAIDQAVGSLRVVDSRGEGMVRTDGASAKAVLHLRRGAHVDVRLDPDPEGAAPVLERLGRAAHLAFRVDAAGPEPHRVAEAAFGATGDALGAALARRGAAARPG